MTVRHKQTIIIDTRSRRTRILRRVAIVAVLVVALLLPGPVADNWHLCVPFQSCRA